MILDNYGYSNNNEMNQGAADDLNPYGKIQQESKQKKGMFLVGLLTGVLLSTLMVGCVYVGIRFNDLWSTKRVRLTSADGAVAESIVNDDSLKKLEAIEDVIDKYYYKEEDIHTQARLRFL